MNVYSSIYNGALQKKSKPATDNTQPFWNSQDMLNQRIQAQNISLYNSLTVCLKDRQNFLDNKNEERSY